MKNYYERLGVKKEATLEEIKNNYKQLVKTTHPDVVKGKEEEFERIQEAYEVLSDSQKRRDYDGYSFSNPSGFIDRFVREKLRFYLPDHPEHYDHYNYINEMFELEGSKRLIPGQTIENPDYLWEQIQYVGYILDQEEERILRETPKPKGELKERIDQINRNEQKLGAVSLILCSCEKRKKLYDLSLGVDNSDEMKEIERLIGGIEGLIQHINEHARITGSRGIFSLRNANLLSPENFNQLVRCGEDISDISMILEELENANLLTQANFERIIQNKRHAIKISGGLARLELAGILNQTYFDILVSTGKLAKSVGSNLETLQMIGILNTNNVQMVINKISDADIWDPLYAMQQEGILTKEQTSALLWSGSEELRHLNGQIDKMIAHGLFLLTCDVEKGKTALLLALDLKKDLKNFFEKEPQAQRAEKEQFKTSFITKLHLKDELMGTHREHWKVIVANILIAFTGLGLFAIAVNYGLKGRCFFAQTQREQLVETIHSSAGLIL